MTQPVWQTPAGSLGVIPENVFYSQDLVALTPPEPIPSMCTATTATTDIITCDTTAGAQVGYIAEFVGTEFGGLQENTSYYVLEIISATQFRITAARTSTVPVSLATATGNMTARFYRPVRYQLVAGQLPAGVQITSNGLVTGVPQAVSTVQGVPSEVNEDVISKFVIRAYTYFANGAVDQLADRTFTLTITGNDPPRFITPPGAFANNNTAAFVASFSGTTMSVSSLTSGSISLGMWVRGPGVEPGTTVVGYITGSGTTGTYRVSIRQFQTSTTCTGVVGVYFDGDQVVLQIEYEDGDPNEEIFVRQIGGEIPPGLSLSASGLLSGYIAPAPNVDEPPGYDLTPSWITPYDFLVSAISRNYQFTLEVTDRKASDIRTFTIFVYNKDDTTSDDTYITADGTFVTADVTNERAPFLINADPSDLGTVRSDNYFAYRFRGQDYDGELFEYTISVDQGLGLPPGLELDPYSGWYYGFIPDQGLVQIEYSFNIRVRARTPVVTAVTASTVTAGDFDIGQIYRISSLGTTDWNVVAGTTGVAYNVNDFVQAQATGSGTGTATTCVITCDDTSRDSFVVGSPVTFEGDVIGGLDTDQEYFITAILSISSFQISLTDTVSFVVLTSDSTTSLLQCVSTNVPISQPYPFTLSVTGVVDSEVTWITDSDLGVLQNGETSLLKVEAVNVGGRELSYRLRPGAFNELPQALELLPTGEIAGRVTFNTFALDLGSTTFDVTLAETTGQTAISFDSTFVFTVNAYAEDTAQTLFQVSEIIVQNGGSGYSSAPTIVFNTPVGATAAQATGTVQVASGAITGVVITDPGDGYTETATFTLTGAGSGAVLTVVMEPTGSRDAISVFKTFSIRVDRTFRIPYQDLYVLAMPPTNDRAIIQQLLGNQEIFVPEYIFRPTDPNFGLSTMVKYQHAFGLEPETLETYVNSLALNHYRKNLVLGPINTAQARDNNGNVVYEVVYSSVIDDLVNAQGQSVSKIVSLPYSIIDPLDGSTVINSVYPNSLVNMRDQVIDVVGRITDTVLPLWMTSKQSDGRVLGFTPAWVICYTKPGRARQIAYYIDTLFGQQLNVIDFTVDRYILDNEMLQHWNASIQNYSPDPVQTTFDRVDTEGFADQGDVQACTDLAFADVNRRTIQYINDLGGLDGTTWIAQAGQTPPVGTRVTIRNGSRMVFVKQEAYLDYEITDDAWSNFAIPFDEGGFDAGSVTGEPGSFDYGPTIDGGYSTTCTATSAGDDFVTAQSTTAMRSGDAVWFTGLTFGGVDAEDSEGNVQRYQVFAVDNLTVTATVAGLDRLTVSSTAALTVGDQVWFAGDSFGGIVDTAASGLPITYYVVDIPTATTLQISTSPSGTPVTLSTATGSVTMYLPRFQITTDGTSAVQLSTDSGTMIANYGNLRMAIWEIAIEPGTVPNVDDIIELTPVAQTVTNDFVASTQGLRYSGGTLLYRPGTPQQDLTRVNWQPLITATTIISAETTFDFGSVQYIEPVDIYDPTDARDKYLVFPKTNILG